MTLYMYAYVYTGAYESRRPERAANTIIFFTDLNREMRLRGRQSIAVGGHLGREEVVTRACSGHLGGEAAAVTHNRHLVEAPG